MPLDEALLIALVHKHPSLYNTEDTNYNNLTKKEEIWIDIAKQLDTSVTVCKNTWNTLRDSLRRALKRRAIRALLPECGPTPFKKYRHEDEMAFLLPYFKDFKELKDFKLKERSCDSDENFEDTAAAVEVIMENDDDYIESSRSRRRQDECVWKRGEGPVSHHLEHLPGGGGGGGGGVGEELEAFFACVAATVRAFPPRMRVLAKQRVYELVSNMELQLVTQQEQEAVKVKRENVDD